MSLINSDAVLNSFKTIKEMYEARHRNDIVEDLKGISNDELNEILKTRSVFTLDVPSKLRILYFLESKLKVADVRSVLVTEDKFEFYLVVLRGKTSAANTKAIQELADQVQVFEIKELQFNISTHSMVPKHRLIESNDETLNAIFQKLNIKSRSQLPVILKADPMAKFFNAKSGDLIEITRFSPTSGEHIFYRICV